jgi:hypothetical protein
VILRCITKLLDVSKPVALADELVGGEEQAGRDAQENEAFVARQKTNGISILVLRLYAGYVSGNCSARYASSRVAL